MASNSLAKTAFFCLILISMVSVFASSFQFDVGGKRGWIIPNVNETNSFNHWASKNRFLIGDTLYFKYGNDDSVLLVDKASYKKCDVSNPVMKFEDGETVFRFDRAGLFYFISGQPGHCSEGQRMIVWVMEMMHPGADAPEPAPSPEDGEGWDSFWGPPPVNSTLKLTVASYFMTAFGGMLVVLYLLM